MIVDCESAPSGRMAEWNCRATFDQALILKRSYLRQYGLNDSDLRIARITNGDVDSAVFMNDQGQPKQEIVKQATLF